MTKSDFFRIIIKVFGLVLLLFIIHTFVPVLLLLTTDDINYFQLFLVLLFIAIVILIILLIILKPDKIINGLKLDQGFDEDRIDFQNFNNENLLKFAIIVMGGYLLINNFGILLTYIFYAFKSSVANSFNVSTEPYNIKNQYIPITINIINIFLGYLLIKNNNFICRILKKKDK